MHGVTPSGKVPKPRSTPGSPFFARCRTLATALAAALLMTLTACAPQPSSQPEGTLPVMASFYPLQFVVEAIGQEQVHVTSLTPHGADPHSVELSPAIVRQLDSTEVLVYLSGFQPAVDEAVRQHQVEFTVDAARAMEEDVAGHDDEDHDGHNHDDEDHDGHSHDDHAGHQHGGADPHFWLDPLRLAIVADDVRVALQSADPLNADLYAQRAEQLISDLEALDAEMAHTLTQCRTSTFIVTHEAFGYLAAKYHLNQVGISGLDPEQEPSPARLKEVSAIAKEHGVSTIFYEQLISDKVATTLANDLELVTAVLDPLEGLVDDSKDYFVIMRENLQALSGALDC